MLGRNSMRRDLFDAEGESKNLPAKTVARGPAHALLPANLEQSLTFLDGQEFSRLLTAVMQEASRRGVQATPVLESNPSPRFQGSRGLDQKGGSNDPVSATKANLVRAAIKAGVKPSRWRVNLRATTTPKQRFRKRVGVS